MRALQFSQYLNKLSALKRTGWVRSHIPSPESVAEHTFEATMLGWFYANQLHLKADKVIKMMLIHDLGESVIGDIVLYRGARPVASLKKKEASERKAMKVISATFGNKGEFMKLWNEYSAGKSKEAKLALQVDKLQMAMRAFAYEKKYKKNLEEFWLTAKHFVTIPLLRKELDMLYDKRKIK